MIITKQKQTSDFQGRKFEIYKNAGLETIERELYNVLSDSKGPVRDMSSHILNAGGKRVRPLLVMYSGLVFSKLTKEIIQAAVAAELIHMASLVHDDIIDNSYLRRSRPSVNKKWGNHYAVLGGDYLFAKAFEVLSSNRLMESMDYMITAIKNMCWGEINQAEDKFRWEVGMKEYYERISRKTAIFLECCCKSGAVAAGADKASIEAIGEYGLNLGIAFQIIDDILDFCGDPDTMGKPVGEDFRQGNITIPIILLQRNQKYKNWIKDLCEKKEVSDEIIQDVLAALKDVDAIGQSFSIAETRINRAKKCLDLLPKSEYSEVLYNLADILKSRIN